MLLINGFIEKLNVFPTWLYVIEVLFPTSDLNLKSPTSILAIAWCKPSLNNSAGLGARDDNAWFM